MNPTEGRPERYIWQTVPVPPAPIRPSVQMGLSGGVEGSNEDDLTVKLSEICYTNQILAEALAKGTPIHMLAEDWEFLQLQCAMMVNAELPGVPAAMQVCVSIILLVSCVV